MVAGLQPLHGPGRFSREGVRAESGGGDRRSGQGREEAGEPADRAGAPRRKTEIAQGRCDRHGIGHRRQPPAASPGAGRGGSLQGLGKGGPIDIPVADAERLPQPPTATRSTLSGEKSMPSRPPAPLRHPGPTCSTMRRAPPSPSFSSRQSEQSRSGRAPASSGGDRPESSAIHGGERPARARRHRQPRQPADCARTRQPRLGRPLRRGSRSDAQRPRHRSEPPTHPELLDWLATRSSRMDGR